MVIEHKVSSADHFETHHSESETVLCIQHAGNCAVAVEIKDASDEETRILSGSIEASVNLLDNYLLQFDTSTGELFPGLLVKIEDGLTESGGEAHADLNQIVFDRAKNVLSLNNAEQKLVELGILSTGDWTRTSGSNFDPASPGSCITYNLIHEFAHLIDEQGEGTDYEAFDKTVTKYGETKPKESLAEAFTHLILGQNIPDESRLELERIVKLRLSKLRSTIEPSLQNL